MPAHARMMHALFLLLPVSCVAQSFTDAISGYPALSSFKALLQENPSLAPLLTGASPGNSSQNYTILVPSNKAFTAYREDNGADVAALPMADLQAAISYHILEQELPSPEIMSAPPSRLVVPTKLTGEKYNNRTAGAELEGAVENDNADGQVVIINVKTKKDSSKRQVQESISVLSGLHDETQLTVVDGVWAHGVFHMVDNFLTLPRQCTKTIDNRNLTALTRALVRTELSGTLDSLFNVTCIGPTNRAFNAAGNPQDSAEPADLVKALTFHTLKQPVYTNFLKDGQKFETVSNETIRVTVNSTGIWFNDAKLVTENVLTNNGVIQVVDKVMSPLPASSTTPENPDESSTPTASATPSSTSSSAAIITSKTGFEALYLTLISLSVFIGIY